MTIALRKCLYVLALIVVAALSVVGQSSLGSLSGTVVDQKKAVVSGAAVVVKNIATNQEFSTETTGEGTFSVPSLAAGVYTATITASGFKQAVVTDIKIDVGKPSSIVVELEVGAATEVVTVVGGGELLQTQTATVGTTITGRQITDLPFTSRDALDLVLLLPGTNTPGTPRTSTVNGLPKGSLNITIDGINVQDNSQKSAFGGGFFTYVRPRIDAIDEVTVSTATPGAESSGEGAVQIKFVTRSGTNEFHGSLYEYHRESSFNANYWFNNRNGLPRDPIHLNQYGVRVGGPISIPGVFSGKDKLFFFTNLEEFRLPEAVSRTRTFLNPRAQTGIFTTATGAQVNLLARAAATNCNPAGATATPFIACTSTIDPTIGSLLSQIQASTSAGSVATLDPNRNSFSFTNTGGQLRRFGAVRLDYNITNNHHFESVWNYDRFGGADVDFLNGVDPPFPGFFAGVGGQHSLRFTYSAALRSTLTSNLINEFRFGVQGGNSFFRDTVTPSSFDDLGGFSLTFNNATLLPLTNPQASRSNSRRNSPVRTFTDTVTWVKGTHSFNFGGEFSRYSTWSNALNNIVPSITFGLDSNDPANRIFVASNFPTGTSTTDRNIAGAMYALLTGRVTTVSANAYLDEETGKLVYLGPQVNRFRQYQYGVFGQDTWRVRPNLTITYGLRWEVQEPFVSENSAVTFTPFEQIFGVSQGRGLFNPGVNPGATATKFDILEPNQKPYNSDKNNFLPSFGIAWTPNWKDGILSRFFGGSGQTVLRAGYSIASVREGTSIASSILAANPGGITSFDRSTTLTGVQSLTAGTLFRDRSALAPPAISTTVNFPVVGAANGSANTFEPNLRIGYVQSWSAGIQRELNRDTVLEVRYVGNRGVKLWRQVNLNEVNVIENGYINEFRLAQRNLAENIRAGRSALGFAYAGPNTNTSPLPITLAYISAVAPANAGACGSSGQPTCATFYGNALFTNSTLIGQLSPNNANANGATGFGNGVVGFASNIFNNSARAANAIAAGLPPNLFIVNPDYRGGAFVVTNTGRSYYDALTVELRRRLSAGLLIQGSYTWSKSLTNMFASNLDLFANPPTFRDDRLGRTQSPFDIRHGLKLNWIYEMPFGRGKQFGSGVSRLADIAIGGWEWHGTARLQSGTPFQFGNVQLVGMTKEELQKSIEIRKNPTNPPGVTFLPDDIILNTRRAFNTDPTSSTGFSSLGVPTGRYIAPASSNGCLQAVIGQCGFANLIMYGPRFLRLDMSVIKRFKFTENTNIELRAEFLNAINNQNFKVGSAGNEVTSVTNFSNAAFGQTTEAYRDISTTNDPGGRIVQFVFRFNF